VKRDLGLRHQVHSEREAGIEHWQPIIGSGSIATGYVAFTDVAPVPSWGNISPNLDFAFTATGEELPDVDTEQELAAISNVESSPVQATLIDLGKDDTNGVHTSVSKKCTCPVCLQESRPGFVRIGIRSHRMLCRMALDCWRDTHRHSGDEDDLESRLSRLPVTNSLLQHEAAHFKHQRNYKCAETDCGHLTKQWRDLKRHYRAKHCTQTPDFPCDVLGCKFGGKNGFHRKDKLASHYKSMHQGQATSIARPRNILPAPANNAISGSGTGQSSQ